MLEPGNKNHIAGIVPVAGQPLDFEMDWSDSLMPLAANYTAVERAVVECAWAGCKTIWIVCNDDTSPLIRYRIGDFVKDPVWLGRKFEKYPSKVRKDIPVFYVPIHPKDRTRRDSLGWSALHGAFAASRASGHISRWMAPSGFYVAFPYGVYDPKILREWRREIKLDKGFYLAHNNRTICDGEYLGFKMTIEDVKLIKKHIRTNEVGKHKGYGPNREIIPLQERWSARFFTLDRIFECVTLEGANIAAAPWYYPIDSWEKYCTFLGSEERREIKHPGKLVLGYRELNQIGEQND